jgi:hypothetical protein
MTSELKSATARLNGAKCRYGFRSGDLMVLDRMAVAPWRIRRLSAIQSSLLNAEILRQKFMDRDAHPDFRFGRAFPRARPGIELSSPDTPLSIRFPSPYDRACKTLRDPQQKWLPRRDLLPNEPTAATNNRVSRTPGFTNPYNQPVAIPSRTSAASRIESGPRMGRLVPRLRSRCNCRCAPQSRFA